MPRRPRIIVPNTPQHVIQRGNNRQACFRTIGDGPLFFSNLGWDDFMHTTIDIDDQLLLYAKHQAVQQGCTIKKILEDALRDFFRIKH